MLPVIIPIARRCAALLLFVAALPALAASPTIVWQKTLGEPGIFYRPFTSAAGPGGTLFVAGSATPAAATAPDKPLSFWIWKLDGNGEPLWRTNVENPTPEHRVSEAYRAMRALVPAADGGVAAIVEFQPHHVFFIRLDAAGKQAVMVPVPLVKSDGLVYDLAPAAGDHYVLAGRDGEQPFVMEIDANGKKVRTIRFDRGDRGRITRIMPLAGGYLVCGELGNTDDITGARKLWLARLDSNGNVIAETMLPGRNPAVAFIENGTIALAYDRGGKDSLDWVLTAFSNSLTHKWDRPLIAARHFFPAAISVVADSDGFVVGGSDGGDFVLWRVSGGGALDWTYRERRTQPTGWLTAVESMTRLAADPVAVSMVAEETEEHKPSFRVGIVRVAGLHGSRN